MEPGQARRLQAAALGRLRRSFTAERQRQDPQTHVARTVLGELRATGELGLNPVGILTIFCWSERRDLNSGPPVPQTGALTGLRYAPKLRPDYSNRPSEAQDTKPQHMRGRRALSPAEDSLCSFTPWIRRETNFQRHPQFAPRDPLRHLYRSRAPRGGGALA